MVKVLRVLTVLAILAVLVLNAMPLYADTPNPDSPPSVDRTKVYRNLLETGDMLFVFEANIPYATPPDTPITETFIWRLMNGGTELGSTIGYAYHDNGYGYNVYSMYFSASDVTALGMVWGTAYTIKLSGNPVNFITPPIYNFTISASDYTSLTTSEDNKVALASELLFLAGDLNVKWALASDYRLTLETETGTVLSIYGEDVFRGSIFGVQAMAPQAFRFVIRDIEITDRSWNTTYVTSLENQWQGTWVEGAKNASRDLLGTTYDLTSLILLALVCIGLIVANLMLTGDHWNALLDVAFVLVIAARLGIYGLVFLGFIAALCVIYIGTKIWKLLPT